MTGWRKRQVLEMAREAGFDTDLPPFQDGTAIALKLAALVASAERDRFLAALRQLHDSYSLASDPNGLKERGQA